MIEEIIQKVVENPTEDNKEEYFKFVQQVQYSLLQDAYTYNPKTWEFFDKKREAFAYKRECSKMFLKQWVKKYGSTENSPIAYADTLNIPFQEIKVPK